uniref:Guanylate cyclase domain-containing protein n=1 Tax=viral metagenome TaxID=1070528 RepID=A0A6C0EKB1_9ZZZZ
MSKINGCIMFTDIASSSKLWKRYQDEMIHIIQRHEQLIMNLVRIHDGTVVKTIGDAVMAYFDELPSAVLSAISIQRTLRHTPIVIGDERIHVRIGICCGEMFERRVMIQNCSLIDYYGSVVNTASRMESKISPIDGFALCLPEKLVSKVEQIITANCHVQLSNECKNLTLSCSLIM